MAKRIADKELTDRNWDQEEEEEDAGMFSVASQEVLKTRAIKLAVLQAAVLHRLRGDVFAVQREGAVREDTVDSLFSSDTMMASGEVPAEQAAEYVPEKVKKAEKKLEDNPYDLDAWSILIREAQNQPIDKARKTYERLVAQFPSSGRFWKLYIEAEHCLYR